MNNLCNIITEATKLYFLPITFTINTVSKGVKYIWTLILPKQ